MIQFVAHFDRSKIYQIVSCSTRDTSRRDFSIMTGFNCKSISNAFEKQGDLMTRILLVSGFQQHMLDEIKNGHES